MSLVFALGILLAPIVIIFGIVYVACMMFLTFAFGFLFIIDPIMCLISPKWRALEPQLIRSNKNLTKTAGKGKLTLVGERNEMRKVSGDGRKGNRDQHRLVCDRIFRRSTFNGVVNMKWYQDWVSLLLISVIVLDVSLGLWFWAGLNGGFLLFRLNDLRRHY